MTLASAYGVAMVTVMLLPETSGKRPLRLVWGSDWPHTLFERSVDDASERRLLDAWLPDARERAVVLGHTPRALFRFAA